MSKVNLSTLPEDTYLEMRLVRKEVSEPPAANDAIGIMVTLLLAIPVALSFARLVEQPLPQPEPLPGLSVRVGPQTFRSNLTTPQQSTAIAPQGNFINSNRPEASPNSQMAVVQSPGHTGCIFQAAPVLSPAATRGVVLNGQAVTLTGVSMQADGVLWNRAINEVKLVPSRHPAAQNQLQAKQPGWIAAVCFPQG